MQTVPESVPPIAVDPAPSDPKLSDASVAVRNGLRLASSLIATWAVALLVRFQLPRMLGPELFGRYNFVDAFTGGFFSLLSLGVGTYIMKEIPIRPRHASDFFGGLLIVRAVLGALAVVAIAVIFRLSNHPAELEGLALVFALVHFVIGVNGYLSNVLQAASHVNALATMNVVAKLIWGGGLMLALYLKAPLWMLAVPSLLSELLKGAVLVRAARGAVDLRVRFDFGATRLVVLASLPFFANSIALELGYRIDVSMLAFMAPGNEVGWYSAANSFAGLALLVSPALGWVVMPLLARARTRSDDELYAILRLSLRGVLMLVIPVTLGVWLMADLCVELAFGAAFLPAAHAVRVLAPMFIATYVAMLLSNALIVLQRSWTLTLVSFTAVVVEPLIILGVVPLMRDKGPGYVAAAAALGLALSEVATVALLLRAVGKKALDRHTVSSVLKCLVVCVAVVLLDRSLTSLGYVRFAIDLVCYVVGVFATGAVRIAEVRSLVALVRARRSGNA